MCRMEKEGKRGPGQESGLSEVPLTIKVVGEEADEEEEGWDLVIRCEHCGRPVLKINSGVVRFREDYETRTGVWCECPSSDDVVRAAALFFDYPINMYWCVLCTDCYSAVKDVIEESSKLIYGLKALADNIQLRLEKVKPKNGIK